MKVARKVSNWPVVLACPVREILAGRITQFRELVFPGQTAAAYGVGSVLFPREHWSRIVVLGAAPRVIYRDSWSEADETNRKIQGLPRIVWEDPETMPDSAARCKLQVTAARLQRVQDATYQDFEAEGVQIRPEGFYTDWGVGPLPRSQDAFAAMWDASHDRADFDGLLSFKSNPKTWVYTFSVVHAGVTGAISV